MSLDRLVQNIVVLRYLVAEPWTMCRLGVRFKFWKYLGPCSYFSSIWSSVICDLLYACVKPLCSGVGYIFSLFCMKWTYSEEAVFICLLNRFNQNLLRFVYSRRWETDLSNSAMYGSTHFSPPFRILWLSLHEWFQCHPQMSRKQNTSHIPTSLRVPHQGSIGAMIFFHTWYLPHDWDFDVT